MVTVTSSLATQAGRIQGADCSRPGTLLGKQCKSQTRRDGGLGGYHVVRSHRWRKCMKANCAVRIGEPPCRSAD